MKIGFIGQGWIGRNFANEFESRGFTVVRYALELEFADNKEKIAACDIVFIAVPTPTTEDCFDESIVRETLSLIGVGKTAVIKSTMLPGVTEKLQLEFPEIFILHSPEFLVEKTAAYDAAHPKRNIVGIPVELPEHRKKAEEVMKILPKAPYEKIMPSRDAEMVKYAGNCYLYTKVIFTNILFDLADEIGCDWETLREAVVHDPRIGESHTAVLHASGRGAGGHCFIKDFEALRQLHRELVCDENGAAVLQSLATKNIELLKASHKDIDLLEGVYGSDLSIKN